MANECPRGLTDNPEDFKVCMNCFLDLEPKCAYSYYHRGNIQYDWDLYEDAIKNYEHSIELNPKHAVSYHNLGDAKYELGLYEEAIENYKRAIELNPKQANYYYNLGLCQVEIDLEHLAVESFKKFLNLEGDKTSERVEYAKRIVNKNIK